MLTPFDEYPVHQSSYPFSHIPVSDYSWDDGYFFGVFSPEDEVFLATGLRVNPNTDMVGGYAMLNVSGRQTTVRFNRCWRPDFSLKIGPYQIEFVELLRKIRLILGQNASGISFDLLWEGCSPPVLEDHHSASRRGRLTTNKSRYSQPGMATGILRSGDRSWNVTPAIWGGVRDHSWGIYAERPPLAPDQSLLPPYTPSGPQRALRIWMPFRAGPFSGFFHMHEDAFGNQQKFNDVFGTPFAGSISIDWDTEHIALASGRHALKFQDGTRIVKSGRITLIDEGGRQWLMDFEVLSPPWLTQTLGYNQGSWKDGGNFHTYHGSESLALEWDEFDFSRQPTTYTPYRSGAPGTTDRLGLGFKDGKVHGTEYAARLVLTTPDGIEVPGSALFEHFINGPYHPYEFD